MPEAAAISLVGCCAQAREEFCEHVRLAELLNEYLDPSYTFWSSLENKPLSLLSGLFQKRRGCKSGLPDLLILYRGDTGTIVIFIELKSRRGVASKAHKQIRAEMLPTGAGWFMARSARSAMTALYREPFREGWTPPHPKVAAERREAKHGCVTVSALERPRSWRALTSPHRATSRP